MFAFSRDNALLGVPSLYSATAYGAVTAINVIGITPAYGVPEGPFEEEHGLGREEGAAPISSP
ncbi:hypothetical protein OG897_15350 [Streptomyces sp. NBC_00237]|uniref:hypothetical protein n=1 Tax=Streptomyces sp. NBC_00237 TaxID=2975687 RepID=UPI00225A752F|nr:hypothetical protein [Streptomyces sp. NBC_00237]MCX5202821.1 hypothetical protein [Streptomyces sp. NBC_00237]